MIECAMGKILNVDLSTLQCSQEVIPDQVYEQVLSGLGLSVLVPCNGVVNRLTHQGEVGPELRDGDRRVEENPLLMVDRQEEVARGPVKVSF